MYEHVVTLKPIDAQYIIAAGWTGALRGDNKLSLFALRVGFVQGKRIYWLVNSEHRDDIDFIAVFRKQRTGYRLVALAPRVYEPGDRIRRAVKEKPLRAIRCHIFSNDDYGMMYYIGNRYGMHLTEYWNRIELSPCMPYYDTLVVEIATSTYGPQERRDGALFEVPIQNYLIIMTPRLSGFAILQSPRDIWLLEFLYTVSESDFFTDIEYVIEMLKRRQ